MFRFDGLQRVQYRCATDDVVVLCRAGTRLEGTRDCTNAMRRCQPKLLRYQTPLPGISHSSRVAVGPF